MSVRFAPDPQKYLSEAQLHLKMEDKNITIDDLAGMIKKGFDGVDQRFDKVEDRLERIEKLLIADHQIRIENLEVAVKQLKELLAVK